MTEPAAVIKEAPVEGLQGTEVRTFLIADVRGYTRFTQEHGDEAAARLAAKFALIAREIVRRWDGQVIELRGDEALAAFRSSRQALRAAAELQERFAHETLLDESLPLRVGIGLDAGEAVPVEGGYRGGALNLAARLSSLAGPSEVLASESVVHLARRVEGLIYVERGLVDLKGFSDPVRVVRIVPEQAESGELVTDGVTDSDGWDSSTQEAAPLPIGAFLGALPEGPLVGRDEEFDRVLLAMQAVESGSGRFLLLAGEPGVGKTRLEQEVTLKARNHGFLVATGRCYEPENSAPFYPFLEALATTYDLAPPDLRAAIPTRWPDLVRLLPQQAGRQTAALSPGQEDRQRLFWAVTGFLQAIATERPVALLLDDLQWADVSSLHLLQHLARHTRGNRVLLVGAYRDVEVNRRHPLESALLDLGRERLVEEIPVRRLTVDQTATLIAATLGEERAPSDLVTLLYRYTEGNPFFIEEVLRALIERGDVYRQNGHWERRSMDEIAVPKSVRSAIGQRLSRLSEESQEVLRQASVLGQTFTFDDLLTMSGRPEAEVERALEDAMIAGLVREAGSDGYAFNHALTQGALYAELPSRRRRKLHLAAGEALERLPERVRQRRAAELAWHFLEGDDPERALSYTLLAAEGARQVFAYGEAEQQYRTALELARELGDRTREVKSLERLAGVLRTTARYDESLALLDEVVRLHRAAGDAAGERRATAHMGRVHALRGTPGEGVARIQALLEDMGEDETERGHEPQPGVAGLFAVLANLYQELDRYHDQLTAAEHALELARAAGDNRTLAESEVWRAAALADLGDLEDGRRMLVDVIPRAQSTGDLLTLSRAYNVLAEIASQAQDYDQERTYLESALEAAEKLGDPTRIAYMTDRLGWRAFMLGDWRSSRSYLEQALSVLRSVGPSPLFASVMLNLGYLSWLEGLPDPARSADLLEEGFASADRSRDPYALALGERMLVDRDLQEGRPRQARTRLEAFLDRPDVSEWGTAVVLPYLAWAYLETDDVDRAADTVTDAIQRAEARGNNTVLAESFRIQGMVRARQDRWKDAEQAFDEAIALARTIRQVYAEARGLYALGLMYSRKGAVQPARQRLTEALAIFERLGAAPDAGRAREALDQPLFMEAGVS